mmetsp:Transcript_21292/g.50361  ORF Transcript_21292/g.50361 Transcript_21292/m.50361 type:complete len:574 (-) Transcript_21292:1436-3157(-)
MSQLESQPLTLKTEATTMATESSPTEAASANEKSLPFDEYSDGSPTSKGIPVMLAPTTRKDPSQNRDRDRTLIEAQQTNTYDLEDGSQSQTLSEENKPPNRNQRLWTILLLVFVVGAIVAAVVAVLLLRRDLKGPTTSSTLAMANSDVTISPTVSSAPSQSAMPSDAPSMEPTIAPTKSPSSAPTGTPSAGPSPAPSAAPSHAPTVSPAPSASPSAAPTKDYVGAMQGFLFGDFAVDFSSTALSNMLAVEWLAAEAKVSKAPVSLDRADLGGIIQRFALLSMDFSLQGASNTDTPPLFAQQGVDECEWEGVVCEDGVVTGVRWAHNEKATAGGSIASAVRLLAPALTSLDLSNNGLVGTIPEGLYDATNLKQVYLFKNDLGGTISRKIGQLDSITHFHLSHNKLTGTIPEEVKSDNSGIRPLQYFNLYSNQLTGTLPQNMRLREVIYFDVGRNQLTGRLPDDLGEKFVAARHLHFDHNDFRGTLPASYNTVGNGRLESFSIEHNRLTGTLQGERDLYNKLVQFTLHGNRFDRIESGTCRMEVPQGEMVEFRADCQVCGCRGYFNLCARQCYTG